jgi:microcystin degradation protein MlrC
MRKIGKRIVLAACIVFSALVMTACSGSGGSKKEIDVAKVADELNASVITTDKLTETKSEMQGSIYFFEDGQVEISKVYMSGNATADEIVVVSCKDEETAKEVADLLKMRVKNQKELFSTYNADEAAKLDKAIVKSSGKYAVLCVCDDYEKAEISLKEAGF